MEIARLKPLVHSQLFWEPVNFTELDQAAGLDAFEKVAWVAVCESCKHIIVYTSDPRYVHSDDFNNPLYTTTAWPDPGVMDPSVPETIRRRYEEAARIRNVAPNAFAGQIRSALEALCEERGATGRTLVIRLKRLAEKGEIPDTLSKMSDAVRIIGNAGVHGATVPPGLVPAIDGFFRAIVEYVYVAPAKLADFEDALVAASEGPPTGDTEDKETPGTEERNPRRPPM